jgi:hypothetical protein
MLAARHKSMNAWKSREESSLLGEAYVFSTLSSHRFAPHGLSD